MIPETTEIAVDSQAAQDAQAKIQDAAALRRNGQPARAEALCREVLATLPGHFDALYLVGIMAYEAGDIQRAVELTRQAVAANPAHAGARNAYGAALSDLKEYGAALGEFDRALALKPDLASAYNNRGNALQQMRRLDESRASFDKAIALKPTYAQAFNNRGSVLADLLRHEDAIADYDRALAINPDYAEAHYNRGIALREMNRQDAALQSYERALALSPNYALAHWERGLCLLQMGRFAEGWRAYEWRWKTPVLGTAARHFTQPLWTGETPIEGKALLLHSEQGLGDTLQFCRYAKSAAEAGARVILDVPRPLASLMESLTGVAEIVATGDPLPTFDMHCPLLSLPLALNTTLDTIPASGAYLKADPEKIAAWRTTLGPSPKQRIGISWSGNPAHRNDHNRSIPLSEFVKMLPPGLEYVSLQKDLRDGDRAILADARVRDFGDALQDFSDTAALCDLMDDVISVDTSIAHLAGALGKPVRILLSFSPDWRWLLHRSDTPWYARAKLYRQQNIGDWRAVLTGVRADLSAGV
jgi:tetratricopeptide (TPR) repeat protein